MAIFPLPIAVGSCANKSTHKDVKGVHRQSQTPLKTVFSGMLDKSWTRFTFNIWFLQNPPSPNERLSKGYRIADIKASAHASHKTHACISLKLRGYSRNYGLVCNLGKQMAVLIDQVEFVLEI